MDGQALKSGCHTNNEHLLPRTIRVKMNLEFSYCSILTYIGRGSGKSTYLGSRGSLQKSSWTSTNVGIKPPFTPFFSFLFSIKCMQPTLGLWHCLGAVCMLNYMQSGQNQCFISSHCWLTNRPKCEHALEQSYSGMYSIFLHSPMLCIPFLPIAMVV